MPFEIREQIVKGTSYSRLASIILVDVEQNY